MVEEMAMQFHLLNGMQAHEGDQPVQLGDRQQRLMLALLLLAEGRPVTIEQLIDKIWGDDPIKTARHVISHYASGLRQRLGRSLLPPDEIGYVAKVGREQVDVHRFRDLVAEARSLLGTDDTQAAHLLRKALRQWGGGLLPGEPLRGLPGPGAVGARVRLQEEHRAALLQCLDAELRLGRHMQLVPDLQDLAAAWQRDEDVTRLLMLALHRAGRSSDALAAYDNLRRTLRDEFGNDPGAPVQELQQRILRQDPALAPPAHSYEVNRPGATMRSSAEIGKDAVRLVAEAVRGESWTSQPVEMLQLVRVHFADDEAAQRTLAQVEADPADTVAVAALGRVLEAYLDRDQTFLKAARLLVEQASRAKAGGSSISADQIKNASVYNAPVHVSGDFNIS
ncbi:AfsR/SARP family transcriptional regulator [Nonomuraea candida]|uniref:AfsR/SARP family transcriptional regulator n=1 Tax=Nonomuraea candida TaxID=359159 RepID=UPI00069374AF|nr:AfsR/SARP family transcriptional regulator [Nonomuraea candida]